MKNDERKPKLKPYFGHTTPLDHLTLRRRTESYSSSLDKTLIIYGVFTSNKNIRFLKRKIHQQNSYLRAMIDIIR